MSKFIKSSTSKYKFGAHMSTAGGVSNSVINAYNTGCNSFALFLKSPRKWVSPQYTPEEIEKFKKFVKEYKYDPMTDILPHGQYFINLANPDEEKAQKSYDSFIDDLKRCESLGIGLYNLHPGSSLKGDHPTQLKQLASYLNKAIKETEFVTILLENMAGTGNLVGSNLEDLHTVIDLIDDKSRIGVCVDTCHTFAAGYDISSVSGLEKFWDNFDKTVGLKYLKAMHLNDSKAPLGANRDLHEKLGEGYLTLKFFHVLATHFDFLQKIPIVLETPQDNDNGYGEEIKLLEWLETIPIDSKLDDNKEFTDKYTNLQKNGSKSRKEQMTKFEAKQKKPKRQAGTDIMSQMKKKVKK
ncbi:similar to Saccharomyces cerevisiae YKL114C APN1 Major apurinic/apyrimidinic endonuclease, 3'-repair diesterase involved in repair of DNA damage by oxidation and alkylating agents [Maudiozyma saulgeensis]|uniref:Apurinic-apyrimidinic endonuclease 1 n=1 Tax=Maudiozyma saulgeensis TaxID=1789683 RepID=A0A1X7QZT8_9SACH|nr:similar to Saccharomyces cerevisiae YKL114C APN1 Major apurinic/apyrimidinic endonuclease, 3'-repair diesterase involved in repair of DNA damage by oxidation and alkylating agents [Kazachstania saulgeensis]